MKNKRGFSLTELLAVVVLLGVIIAIAIPSYNKYIEKTKDKKYESYEYAMQDAAEMYVQQCLVKNECPNGQEYNNVLGQKVYLNELGIDENLSECQLDESYVRVNHDGSPNTEIDNYDYKVCLVCGEHRSEYCDSENSLEEEENDDVIIDLDNNKSEENIPKPENPDDEENNIVKTEVTLYTNSYDYIFKDNNFEIGQTEYPIDICKSDKKGGIECSLNASDFINKKAELIFKSKTSEVILKIIYDDKPPTIEVNIDNTQWTQGREVTFIYNDDNGIKDNSLTLNGNVLTKSSELLKTNGSHEVCVKDLAKNKSCKSFIVEKVTSQKPNITMQTLNSAKYYDYVEFTVEPSESGLQNDVEVFIAKYGMTNLTKITPQKTGNTYRLEGITGTKDVYIKVLENTAGILSDDSSIVTIDGQQYHRYTGIKLDNAEPTINVSVNNTQWTQGRVVTFTYSDDNSIASIKLDGNQLASNATTATITSNGSYEVCVKDVANKETCKNFIVEKVTDQKPTITMQPLDNNKYYDYIEFVVNPSESGLKNNVEVFVAKSGTKNLTKITPIKTENTYRIMQLSGVEDVYIKVLENTAGILSDDSSIVTIDGQQYHKYSAIKFDKSKPTINVSVDNSQWTQGRVVTFTYSDDNSVASIKLDESQLANNATTATITSNGSHTVCVKDVANKENCKDFTVSKVTTQKPSITLNFSNTTYYKTLSFSITPSESGLKDEIKAYIANSGSTSLTEISLQKSGNQYTIIGLTGIKDVYIKTFENNAGISSGNGVSTITISGQKYHKFSGIKFDNTAPTCSITTKYEGTEVTSGKYPYLTLYATVTDSHSGHDGTYSWNNGAGASQTPKVSEVKNYTLTVYDNAGNPGTCSYNTTNRIDGTAPKITFMYNGSTTEPAGWQNTNVVLTAKLESRNNANLLYYNYNNTGNHSLNTTSYTTGTLATFSSTGTHSGSIKTAIKGKNGDIIAEKTSSSIRIDNTPPYRPYLTFNSVSNGKIKENTCGTLSKESTTATSCKVTYRDYCWGKSANFDASIAALEPTGGSSGGVYYLFSTDNVTYKKITSFATEINDVSADFNEECRKKSKTIYLKACDSLDNCGSVLEFQFTREITDL